MSKYLGTDFSDTCLDAAYRLGCSVSDLEMFSWPECFSNTSGPRKGIGGNVSTVFQVYAFRAEGSIGVKYCHGIMQPWNVEMKEKWT